MPRASFTEAEVVLCTYAARFNGDDFGGVEAIFSLGLRSKDSIKLKIQNIAARLDERGIGRENRVSALTGLAKGQTGRDTNWDWVAPLVPLSSKKLLAKCRMLLERENSLPGELLDSEAFLEGSVRRVVVNAYERNAAARKRCVDHYGAKCYLCGFEFRKVYGEVAGGFIHVHHLRTPAGIGENYEVDPVADLRPVCPNCHAVLHLRSPPFDIEQVQKLLVQRHA